jgi:hypothetical protein
LEEDPELVARQRRMKSVADVFLTKTHVMRSVQYGGKYPLAEESADNALIKVKLSKILADLLHRKRRYNG